MRHVKRWQDVEELLVAGIDVYSTVNVQHIESLNDVIVQISGIIVRETVPDQVFESAEDVVVVDLPPEELLKRLKQGKVYVPQQAARALERFFRRENLVALREIALRQTAERVHEDVETARRSVTSSGPWPTNERLLVCVGPSPTSAKVVRAAKRLADRLGAPWIAVHVAASTSALDATQEELIHRHLMLAERLGAEVTKLTGDDITTELLKYADSRNVTKIVIGKTNQQKSWRRRQTFVDRLVEYSGNVDVLIVRGVDEPLVLPVQKSDDRAGWQAWLGAALSLAVATLVALGFHTWEFTEANLVMIYLLGIVFSAVRFGMWPAIASSVVAVVLFDVLFTRPYYWVAVEDSQYLVTFAVMLVVGIFASTLMARVRRQAQVARENERRTEALYRLTRRFAGMSNKIQLVKEAEKAIAEVFDAYAVVFVPDQHGKILPIVDDLHLFAASASEFAAAQWVFDHKLLAGAGTDTLPNSQALYLPLAAPNGVVGVLAVQPSDPQGVRSFTDRHLLDTFASHVALAVERSTLAEQAQQSRLEAEAEKLRSSLLSAVSHDIRTPLAGIAGASSTLASSYQSLDSKTREELLASINEESERLSQLVDNLLHMTRLSSGKVSIDRQWHPADEVVGSALSRLDRQLAKRPIEIDIDEQLPMLHVDAVLFEQLLVNLVDNATKYSPSGTPITVSAHDTKQGMEIEVADEGRGFAVGDEARVFELFYRGAEAKPDQRGTGIGLAICRAIAEVHGGRIEAHNRPGRGAVVRVTLPHDEAPPCVREENLEPASP